MSILRRVQFASTFFRFEPPRFAVWPFELTAFPPQDKWSAVYSVQTILLSLQSLLGGTELLFEEEIPFLIFDLRTEQRVSLKYGRVQSLGLSRM
jgi:hypothetical protein